MKTLLALAPLALALAGCMGSGTGRTSSVPISPSPDAATQGQALNNAGVGNTVVSDSSLRPAPVDTTQRFEYRDVYVSLTDPEGNRQLAPYFIKADVWSLDKFESISDTLRHYRFRRLVGPDGKSLPDVDPFAPK